MVNSDDYPTIGKHLFLILVSENCLHLPSRTMSTEFFCCSDIHPPYEGVGIEVHKLNEFIKWAKTTLPGPYETNPREPAFIIELQQRNSSSILPPRYFIPIEHHFRHDRFQEIHKASVEQKFQLVAS